uniref:Uncharacterized protein n=1 Tax=Rhizophora mucronata TaxID=61149 RepID=A0A2P2LC09_RHIMU
MRRVCLLQVGVNTSELTTTRIGKVRAQQTNLLKLGDFLSSFLLV